MNPDRKSRFNSVAVADLETDERKSRFGSIPAQPFEEKEDTAWQTAGRYAAQVLEGAGQFFTWPLDAMKGINRHLNEETEEMNRIEQERAERLGGEPHVYKGGVAKFLSENIPTQSDLEAFIEDKTGLPLTPKTEGQKALRMASTIATAPGTALQKAAGATTGVASAESLKAAGVPEPIADFVGYLTGGIAGQKAPESIGKETKPSGMPVRRFEKLTEPHEVSEKKLDQINTKLEKDFKTISDKIIEESPVGETAENLRNDPLFKSESENLLNEAREVAERIKKPVEAKDYKKAIADEAKPELKGFKLNEQEKSFLKHVKDALEEIKDGKVSAVELVEQYRKNNADLKDYYEPGQSRAFNKGKADAILAQNRAIANFMEKSFPETNLSEVFKEGNARWTKIRDVETIDEFVDEMFKEKVNHKKMKEFFNDKNYKRIFKRSLGDKGYADFQTLMKDMMTSEKPYKMLKVAKSQGWDDLARTGLAYMMKPVVGQVKFAIDTAKYTYKKLFNAMIDKPKIAVNWKKAVDSLVAGDFKEAETQFNKLNETVHPEVLPPKELPSPKAKAKAVEEPIEVKGEPVKEKTLETKAEESLEDLMLNREKNQLKGLTPKQSAKKLFDDYGLSDWVESIVEHEGMKTTKEVAKGLRRDYGSRVERIEEVSGKTLEELIEDISGVSSKVKQTPKPKERPQLTHKDESVKTAVEREKGTKEHKPKFTEDEIAESSYEYNPKLGRKELKPKNKNKETKQKPPEKKISSAKRQDISKEGLKKQKAYILTEIENARTRPPNADHVHIDVPGDGEFNIRNTADALDKFEKAVEKNWPKEPVKDKKPPAHKYKPKKKSKNS